MAPLTVCCVHCSQNLFSHFVIISDTVPGPTIPRDDREKVSKILTSAWSTRPADSRCLLGQVRQPNHPQGPERQVPAERGAVQRPDEPLVASAGLSQRSRALSDNRKCFCGSDNHSATKQEKKEESLLPNTTNHEPETLGQPNWPISAEKSGPIINFKDKQIKKK